MRKKFNVKVKKRTFAAVFYMAVAIAVVFMTMQSINDITESNNKLNLNYNLNDDTNNIDIPNLSDNVLFNDDINQNESSLKKTEDASESEKQYITIDESLEQALQSTAGEQENVTDRIDYPKQQEVSISAKYVRPADGYICREYSPTELIYSQTMYDYRTHSGIDLAADAGSTVHAFSNGVVDKIYNDELFGTCIEIVHEDGIVSVYRNLYEDIPKEIEVGVTVNAGDVIAGVGESALCESADVPHLHFEVLKDGKCVNPSDYFED